MTAATTASSSSPGRTNNNGGINNCSENTNNINNASKSSPRNHRSNVRDFQNMVVQFEGTIERPDGQPSDMLDSGELGMIVPMSQGDGHHKNSSGGSGSQNSSNFQDSWAHLSPCINLSDGSQSTSSTDKRQKENNQHPQQVGEEQIGFADDSSSSCDKPKFEDIDPFEEEAKPPTSQRRFSNELFGIMGSSHHRRRKGNELFNRGSAHQRRSSTPPQNFQERRTQNERNAFGHLEDDDEETHQLRNRPKSVDFGFTGIRRRISQRLSLTNSSDDGQDRHNNNNNKGDAAANDGRSVRVADEFTRQATQKSRTVKRVKMLLIVMLICAAVLVTVLVWHFISSDETEDFVVQYHTFAHRVLRSYRHNLDMKAWTAYTLSSVYTSRFGEGAPEAHHDNMWPNTTLENFGAQIKGPTVLAHAQSIFLAPMVTSETMEGWTAYAKETNYKIEKQWIEEMENMESNKGHIMLETGAGDDHSHGHGKRMLRQNQKTRRKKLLNEQQLQSHHDDDYDDVQTLLQSQLRTAGSTSTTTTISSPPKDNNNNIERKLEHMEGHNNNIDNIMNMDNSGMNNSDHGMNMNDMNNTVDMGDTDHSGHSNMSNMGNPGTTNHSDPNTDNMDHSGHNMGDNDNMGNNDTMDHSGHDMSNNDTMDHTGHDMSNNDTMDHTGHDMSNNDTMDHTGHDMSNNDTMDHSGHDMSNNDTMDHSGHNMGNNDATDHSGHNMGNNDATDHSGHEMDNNDATDHSGHDMGNNDATDHSGHDMGNNDTTDHSGHDMKMPKIDWDLGLYGLDENGAYSRPPGLPFYYPVWQVYPTVGNVEATLFDQYSNDDLKTAIDFVNTKKESCITDAFQHDFHVHSNMNVEDQDSPASVLYSPVYSNFEDTNIVALVGIDFKWTDNLSGALPEGVKGIMLVIESVHTGESFTFELDGTVGRFIGAGDLHDRSYDKHEVRMNPYQIPEFQKVNVHDHSSHRMRMLEGMEVYNLEEDDTEFIRAGHDSYQPPEGETRPGLYTVRVYPSDTLKGEYMSNRPAVFASLVALVFFFTSMVFIIYDCLVENRQAVVMNRAVQSNKIVHSLFPATVRDRLFEKEESEDHTRSAVKNNGLVETPTMRLKNFLTKGSTGKQDDATVGSSQMGAPIADMFPATTILFADIAGFTAWSSEREPSQVFELLEAIYREFDIEANKHEVFKVETIGDCYVCATGLPDPQSDHALIMVKFAQSCLAKFQELTRELEITLGPGTASLGIRIGMHSGSVTAGVLRGEKSRFQLFGDTMNTASRMESSGKKNMIQVSPETAKLVKSAGKEQWLVPRADIVVAKGKGEIQTYWIKPLKGSGPLAAVSEHSKQSSSVHYAHVGWETDVSDHNRDWDKRSQRSTSYYSQEDDRRRSIEWNATVLEDLILKVMNNRQQCITQDDKNRRLSKLSRHGSGLILDEISNEVKFELYSADKPTRSKEILTSIGEAAKHELKAYVTRVASMYRDVHFHNFEHASHVTMSANKLMKKVCAQSLGFGSKKRHASKNPKRQQAYKTMEKELFFSTFGISADPLAQFAVVFAALVHDVDHTGVPNVQVINEDPDFAAIYKNISVAEQHSIHVAWDMLMETEFENLRSCMFATSEDKSRFKQLLIHMIIATDIADKARMKKEKKRWNAAFEYIDSWESEWRSKSDDELTQIDVSLRATAVLEQLMLASDIAHTMQHWITYVKWNERLFKERMTAFINGRADDDPREGWYESELGFFDFYIIPLAQRLKDCGVFGSAGDEYLSYAVKNRQEWTEKGQAITLKYTEWGKEQLQGRQLT